MNKNPEKLAIEYLKRNEYKLEEENNNFARQVVNIAIESLEKQILKTPMQNYYNEGDYTWECVKCEETVAEGQNYCHNCGQKLDLD